jgi:hypothetical protein
LSNVGSGPPTERAHPKQRGAGETARPNAASTPPPLNVI